MLKSVKVQDYMTELLITFKPETDLFQAIHMFTDHNISGAPVVNDRGEMVGLLSEVDCLRSIVSYTYSGEEHGGQVGDFMESSVDTVNHDEDIINLAELFVKGQRRRFPVVKNGKLVGQISRKDVLRAFKDFVESTK